VEIYSKGSEGWKESREEQDRKSDKGERYSSFAFPKQSLF
jgi:hypothetical protein